MRLKQIGRACLLFCLCLPAFGCARGTGPRTGALPTPEPRGYLDLSDRGGEDRYMLSYNVNCLNNAGCQPGNQCIDSRCINPASGLPECATAELHFVPGTAQLLPKDQEKLNQVAACLRRNMGLHLTIAGAAAGGGAEQELRMAQERAQAVASYLRERGVVAEQLRLLSYTIEGQPGGQTAGTPRPGM